MSPRSMATSTRRYTIPSRCDERFRVGPLLSGHLRGRSSRSLRELFVEPARRLPERRFVMGGAQYDGSFPWQPNIYFMEHVAPALHPAFYCSSKSDPERDSARHGSDRVLSLGPPL